MTMASSASSAPPASAAIKSKDSDRLGRSNVTQSIGVHYFKPALTHF